MNPRRAFLKKAAISISSALAMRSPPVRAQWLAQNLEPHLLDDPAKPATKKVEITDTDKIEIKLPKIAEKGAAVPITVTSSLEDIQSLTILVEKNPTPLVAKFRLSAELDTFVSARLEMTATSDVIVLVECNDGIYRAKEHVKVIIGGCGA